LDIHRTASVRRITVIRRIASIRWIETSCEANA